MRAVSRSLRLAGLLGIAVLGACAANTNPNPGQLDPALPYPRVMINDDELARGLRFEEPVVLRDEEGFIERVDLTVRALSVNTLKVDYRPVFRGPAGEIIQPETHWRTEFLEARVPERIVILPPAPNAVDYEVQFRWAR